jgi:hypothetical protein
MDVVGYRDGATWLTGRVRVLKVLLLLTSLVEAATGLVVLAYPPIVTWLLFDEDVHGAGVLMSRIAGITLMAFGLACWPGSDTLRPCFAMLTYSSLVMPYLVLVGFSGTVGILLWPAVAVHATLGALLLIAWSRERSAQKA